MKYIIADLFNVAAFVASLTLFKDILSIIVLVLTIVSVSITIRYKLKKK